MKKRSLLLLPFLIFTMSLAGCRKSNSGSKTVEVTDVSLDKETLELEVGKTATLTATVSPDDATDKTVTWSSSAATIASVSTAGLVTGVKAGEAKIYADAGDFRATCTVTVKSSGQATTTYVVTFDSNGGSAVAAQNVESGAKATKPNDPTREGYTFLGWYNGDVAFDFNTPITANLILVAKWQQESIAKFTVTFNSDGGSAVESQQVESGAKATKPADPTKSGYTFVGWYNGEVAFDFNTPITADITLTAHWLAESVDVYQVKFGTKDAITLSPIEKDDDDAENMTLKLKGTASVKAGETIAFTLNGEAIKPGDENEAGKEHNGNNTAGSYEEGYTVHNDAEADVYLKVYDNGYSFWLTGYVADADDEDSFSYKIGDADAVEFDLSSAEDILGEQDADGNKEVLGKQYKATIKDVEAGAQISFFDGDTQVAPGASGTGNNVKTVDAQKYLEVISTIDSDGKDLYFKVYDEDAYNPGHRGYDVWLEGYVAPTVTGIKAEYTDYVVVGDELSKSAIAVSKVYSDGEEVALTSEELETINLYSDEACEYSIDDHFDGAKTVESLVNRELPFYVKFGDFVAKASIYVHYQYYVFYNNGDSWTEVEMVVNPGNEGEVFITGLELKIGAEFVIRLGENDWRNATSLKDSSNGVEDAGGDNHNFKTLATGKFDIYAELNQQGGVYVAKQEEQVTQKGIAASYSGGNIHVGDSLDTAKLTLSKVYSDDTKVVIGDETELAAVKYYVDSAFETEFKLSHEFSEAEIGEHTIYVKIGDYSTSFVLTVAKESYTYKIGEATAVEFDLTTAQDIMIDTDDDGEADKKIGTQYEATVTVEAGDIIYFAHDGEDVYPGDGGDAGNNVSYDGTTKLLTVVQAATGVGIYLKCYEDGGYAVWLSGYTEPKWVALINDVETQVGTNASGELTLLKIELEANDELLFSKDGVGTRGYTDLKADLPPARKANFEAGENNELVVKTAGYYDFYVDLEEGIWVVAYTTLTITNFPSSKTAEHYGVHAWGGADDAATYEGTLSGTTITATIPNDATGFLVASWNGEFNWDTLVYKSSDISLVSGQTEYALPDLAERVTYTVNNIPSEYTTGHDLYFHVWGGSDGSQSIKGTLSGTTLTADLPNDITGFLVLVVKEGAGVVWDGDNFVGQTNDLTPGTTTINWPGLK